MLKKKKKKKMKKKKKKKITSFDQQAKEQQVVTWSTAHISAVQDQDPVHCHFNGPCRDAQEDEQAVFVVFTYLGKKLRR